MCTLLSQTTEAPQIREVLHKFATQIAKPEYTEEISKVSERQRDLLQKDFNLTDSDELRRDRLLDVPPHGRSLPGKLLPLLRRRGPAFGAGDARSGCRPGMSPRQGMLEPLVLAHFAFDWVNRQILPGVAQCEFELVVKGDSRVPGHLVLRRGFGRPRDLLPCSSSTCCISCKSKGAFFDGGPILSLA